MQSNSCDIVLNPTYLNEALAVALGEQELWSSVSQQTLAAGGARSYLHVDSLSEEWLSGWESWERE